MTGQTPILYSYPGSFYSQKAMIALHEKGIKVKKHFINLMTYEQHSDWYMKNINPLGQIPVLVTDGEIIPDSPVIIKWADDNGKVGPTLMPEDTRPKWTEYQRRFEDIKIEIVTYGAMANPELTTSCQCPTFFRNQLGGGILKKKRSQLAEKMMAKNPDMAKIYTTKIPAIKQFELDAANPERVLDEVKKVKDLLVEVNNDLTDSEWLCGSDITIADICLMILLHRLWLAGWSNGIFEDGKLPKIQAYYERAKQRKSFHDVCVSSTSFFNIVGLVMKNHTKAISIVTGFVVLAAAIGVGFALQRK